MSVWKTVSSTRKLSALVPSAQTPFEASKTIPGDFLGSPRRGRHKQTNLHESEFYLFSVKIKSPPSSKLMVTHLSSSLLQEKAAAEESAAGVLKDLAHSSLSCSTGLETEECFYLVSVGFILREMKFSLKS